MKNHDFDLSWKLPVSDQDPQHWIDAIYEAGCDDSTLGVGQYGSIGTLFARDANSAKEAMDSAIDDVRKAIPGATLIEVGPEQVGLSEIANLFGISRQACHKLTIDLEKGFPMPMHSGKSALWHMHEVLLWAAQMQQPVQSEDPEALLEVSLYAKKLNQEIQHKQAKAIAAKARKAFASKPIRFAMKEQGVRRKRSLKQAV